MLQTQVLTTNKKLNDMMAGSKMEKLTGRAVLATTNRPAFNVPRKSDKLFSTVDHFVRNQSLNRDMSMNLP